MPADSPETVSRAFAAAINARDLPGALELWSADAAMVGLHGDCTRGRDAIAPALRALVENEITLEIDLAELFATADVAIATGAFTLRGTGGDGNPITSQSASVVVYHRTADGWRIAIDAPWGLPNGRAAPTAP